jgi:hypothetical protein
MAPGGLRALVSGATVFLEWAAPTVFPATSYIIEAGSVSGAIDQANANIGNYTSYTASPVPPGVYFVRIRAVGGDGTLSAASNEVVVPVGQAGAVCTGAALPPAGLTSTVNGSDVTLNWTFVGGSAPSSYVIEAGSFPGGSNLANVDTLSTGTSFFAPGVGSGTYFVRVRAKNACGVSGGSNEVIVKVGS